VARRAGAVGRVGGPPVAAPTTADHQGSPAGGAAPAR
jgi:hypothetical protein